MANLDENAFQNPLPLLRQNSSLTRKEILENLFQSGKCILGNHFLEDIKRDLLRRSRLSIEDMNISQRKKFHYSLSSFLKFLRRKWISPKVRRSYKNLVLYHDKFLQLQVPQLDELKAIMRAKAEGLTPQPEAAPPNPAPVLPKVPKPKLVFSDLTKHGKRRRSDRCLKLFGEECIFYTAERMINSLGGKKAKELFQKLVEDHNAGKKMHTKLAKPDLIKVSGPEAVSHIVQNDFSRNDYWAQRDLNIEKNAPILPTWDVVQVRNT